MQNPAKTMNITSNKLFFWTLLGFAGLLLGSWWWLPSGLYWDLLDEKLFFLINDSFSGHPVWQWLWAITNYRPFDLILLLLITLPFYNTLHFKTHSKTTLLANFLVLVSVAFSLRIFIEYILGIERLSPTMVFQSITFLHHLVPLPCKDKAIGCFPGDHAMISLVWFFLLLEKGDNKLRCYGLFVVVLASLPRIMSGAHWFSDDAVGSIAVACFSYAVVNRCALGHYLQQRTITLIYFLSYKEQKAQLS